MKSKETDFFFSLNMNHIKSVLDFTKLIFHSTEMLKLRVENNNFAEEYSEFCGHFEEEQYLQVSFRAVSVKSRDKFLLLIM